MTKLKIKLLAFQGAPESVFDNAVRQIEHMIPANDFELVENNPDVLYFLSGGSEKTATKQVSEGNIYLLIGSRHDNSYASATEVKAYLNERKIPSLLLDQEEAETISVLRNFTTVRNAMNNLNGKRLGLIGQISDWLIASAIPVELLKSKLGIELIRISWSELIHYSCYKPSEPFLKSFEDEKNFDLTETARVSAMLSDTIQNQRLDAITVECFPMVQKDGVTACLPLAKFNNDGIPAGCEGDITAIAGMMLCKELTGVIPWMANINKVSNDFCLFSHCTIAPGLVSDLKIKTHFETGKGTAIQGDFTGDLVTIFRFDNSLSRAFAATAGITGRPESDSACRTQIEVKLSENDVKLLKENPLGNHHLIFPGDCRELLLSACLIIGIEVMK